ncbi:MAG: AAA family ATPase [Thermodesulfobacteriota bacterium]
MLAHVKLTNVGPAPKMEMEFGKRLNVLTGDNGLGKSFLLDIAWWCLTRKWPAQLNPRLPSGLMAKPHQNGPASIEFSVLTTTSEPTTKSKGRVRTVRYSANYDRKAQAWTGKSGRPLPAGLVVFAQVDGGFAVWDPARNYCRQKGKSDVQDRPPAYVFSPREVWDGLAAPDGSWLCNGLIRDWAGWQKENGPAFDQLREVLKVLSPSRKEAIEPGELTRISLDDVRDMPTIRMPYQPDVPVVHASSGIRRIMALAYFLVWAWREHGQAVRQIEGQEASHVTFLIDEIESHLHPSWQRVIVPALLSVVKKLSPKAKVQVLAATHSSLVMASVEPVFDSKRDSWFDLDLERDEIILKRLDFEKHGDAANWLTSAAFGLKSGRPPEYEKLVEKAASLLDNGQPDKICVAIPSPWTPS